MDVWWSTALFRDCGYDRNLFAKTLLQQGIKGNETTSEGIPELWLWVHHRFLDVRHLFLFPSFDVNQRDANGNTCLVTFGSTLRTKHLRALIRHGFDIHAKWTIPANWGPESVSCIDFVSQNSGMVRYLLDRGLSFSEANPRRIQARLQMYQQSAQRRRKFVRRCALFALSVLRPMVGRDIATLIARLVWESAWDRKLWHKLNAF